MRHRAPGMSLALQKGLPSNLDVERLVLGAVLLDDRVFVSVAAVLTPQDFSLEKHRRIFRRMVELQARGERIDRVMVANELLRYHELESCDGLSYLVSLDDGLPNILKPRRLHPDREGQGHAASVGFRFAVPHEPLPDGRGRAR